MLSTKHYLVRLVCVLAALITPAWAYAYVFTTIDYPGATSTTVFGINNTGQFVANVVIGGNSASFVYTGGNFNPLPPAPPGLLVSGIGLNDAGSVVGGAFPADFSTEQGFILSNGTYTLFSHPGSPQTEARAIGNSGLVTGVASNFGFIYNPTTGVFTDITFANALFTIAQGINTAGQVVGSYCCDFLIGSTSFLRQPNGIISTFRINNAGTSASGINDNGLIVGTVRTPMGDQAFVGDSSGFQLLMAAPNAVNTEGLGINNKGQVSGTYQDTAGNIHGFIATPASLPTGTTAGGAYTFDVSVVPDMTIFIDPAVSLGFDYEIGTGDPKFASVELPIGIGDSLYTLIVHGQAFALAGGEVFEFAAHGFAKGVAQFRVADIEASVGLDPNNAEAFPTGLTFTTAGTFTGTMTPLCRDTPLPNHANAPVGRGLSPCLSQ